jgi:hypothetical protein
MSEDGSFVRASNDYGGWDPSSIFSGGSNDNVRDSLDRQEDDGDRNDGHDPSSFNSELKESISEAIFIPDPPDSFIPDNQDKQNQEIENQKIEEGRKDIQEKENQQRKQHEKHQEKQQLQRDSEQQEKDENIRLENLQQQKEYHREEQVYMYIYI